MNDRTEKTATRSMIAAAALGAAAMYLLDPDKGRRRRAIGRDRVRALAGDIGDFIGKAMRDAAGRLQGLKAEAIAQLRRDRVPDDLMLIERVRARMGRIVSHPHAIQIGANQGRIMLSGPILAGEIGPLLDAARLGRGVRGVEDELVVHDHPEAVPSLQGGHRRTPESSTVLGENWTPALRVAAIAGGGLLALYGLRSRSGTGTAFAALGIALCARGATNLPADRMLGGARRSITHASPAPDPAAAGSKQDDSAR
jgi:hypothetical protein